jgi:hypothetical protein
LEADERLNDILLGVVRGEEWRYVGSSEFGLPIRVDFSELSMDLLDSAVEDHMSATGLGFDMPEEGMDTIWNWSFQG